MYGILNIDKTVNAAQTKHIILRGIKLQKIIYCSPNKIDWDAQSAFKITNYYTEKEEHMVFCYLKQYVHGGDLKFCTCCFDKEAAGKQDLQLCVNLNPNRSDDFFHIEFGFDGINHTKFVNPHDKLAKDISADGISYRSYRTNDQQGYYWCGELTLSKEFIRRHFDTVMEENSVFLLNFYKIFSDSADHAALFPDSENILTDKAEKMESFVVFNY